MSAESKNPDDASSAKPIQGVLTMLCPPHPSSAQVSESASLVRTPRICIYY